MALERRLGNDPTLRPLLAQFVPLHVDVNDDDQWQAWSSRFEAEGSVLPILFVVRADQQQLYGRSGVPNRLDQFLLYYAQQGGRLLSESQLREMARAAEQAKTYQEQGNMAQAVELVVNFAGSGSYADAALEIERLVADFVAAGRKDLEAAEELLASEEKRFEGVVALVEAHRIYSRLPALADFLDEALGRHRRNTELRESFQQAELIDKAKYFESHSKGARALTTYRQVLTRYPQTPAAELAQARIAELQSNSEAKPVSRSSGTSDRPPDEETTKNRGATYLRLAKSLAAKKKREKAREYAEKAIELLPADSPLAKEAQALLETLG